MASTATANTSIIHHEYPIREPQNAQELVDLVKLSRSNSFHHSLIYFFQVQTTMSQIQDKFATMSDSIMTRSTKFSSRIENLTNLYLNSSR